MRLIEKIINYINAVKSRTEEEKKRAVIFWTIFLIVIIFIIWVITFSLSVFNHQAEDLRLREEAMARARVMAEASTTTNIVEIENSWPTRLRSVVVDGVESVSEGFWVIGSWLHK